MQANGEDIRQKRLEVLVAFGLIKCLPRTLDVVAVSVGTPIRLPSSAFSKRKRGSALPVVNEIAVITKLFRIACVLTAPAEAIRKAEIPTALQASIGSTANINTWDPNRVRNLLELNLVC